MNLVVYAVQQGVNALSLGSLYALMAVGLAMVFGILRLINFAHGDIMMVAAYFAAFGLINHWPLPVTLLVMIAGTVLVGLIIERVGYRPVRGAPEVTALLTSFAVGQILQSSTLILTRLGGLRSPLPLPAVGVLSGVVEVGRITVPKLNVVALVAGIVLLTSLTYFVTRTNLGLSMRAAAEDLTAANLVGININRVIAVAFAISSAMAAVAGLLYAAQAGQINPYMGFTPVLKAFIAAVIGGFGSLAGAVVGGYVLGGLEVLLIALPGVGALLAGSPVQAGVITFLNQWLPSWLSGYRDAFVFVVLILVLLFRPNGLLGRRDQEEMA
jgi:branched-chain amino acid transport system permease protein